MDKDRESLKLDFRHSGGLGFTLTVLILSTYNCVIENKIGQ